jgi:hypothetical protein
MMIPPEVKGVLNCSNLNHFLGGRYICIDIHIYINIHTYID